MSRPSVKKHALPEAGWPALAQAKRSRLFAPISLGPITLKTRTWVPAMVPWRASDEGFVTPAILDWYGRFAQGQPGAIVIEATGVRDVKSGPLLRIGHDRYIPGLKNLCEHVHKESDGKTRLFIQLIDFLTVRRRPKQGVFFDRFLKVDAALRQNLADHLEDTRWLTEAEGTLRPFLATLPKSDLKQVLSKRAHSDLFYGYRERVTDEHLNHIKELPIALPPLFADAAVRAKEAGFDGIELHYAHAYTLASFLSRTNTRVDDYGGALENRLRLPLEVYRGVRQAVGTDYCVGARFLSDEIIPGGSRLQDALYFGEAFARAGMDFLSLSRGGKFDDAKMPAVGQAIYPYTGPSGQECMPTVRIDADGPFLRNAPSVAALKQHLLANSLPIPLVVAGGIASFQDAEALLARGDADVIAAARQSLADPDWWLKMQLGKGEDIERCLFTNYCEGLDQKHKEVTCQLWDRKKLEGQVLSKDGRRRLTAPLWEDK